MRVPRVVLVYLAIKIAAVPSKFNPLTVVITPTEELRLHKGPMKP